MNGEGENFKDLIDKANEDAKVEADDAVDEDLSAISAQADQLYGIFSSLKLTDPETYDDLERIVNEATATNESIANVINRLKALGEAGKRLASSIADVASTGPIEVLKKALGQ